MLIEIIREGLKLWQNEYSIEFGIFIKEGFHSRHAILYDAKSWSDHKRRQLADRLFRQELAEK
ncbi:12737_t:CDS:2 [Funneliformis mosseae]|uniref:12737_t:CDS:1 n=1 Tax=Funneliformis mosseae TaxID=27381 RepID=A0A9N9E2F9_FUNMO|nr:12737_t:CDS:2 [Funneliformis mosseae]